MIKVREIEYHDTLAIFPTVGSPHILYIDKTNFIAYVWNVGGSVYVPLGGAASITVVANYAALPDPDLVPGRWYWCLAEQGWRILGTFKPKGLYYSNGVTWEYVENPLRATQDEVNLGEETEKYVSPDTLKNSSQWDTKVNIADLPATLIFYPTTSASAISGYFKLVTDITDPDYDNPSVDVATGTITTTNQLIAELASNEGVIMGNPGVVNMVIVGNIRRTTMSGTASFYYEVYHRDSLGTETLIATSSTTFVVNTNTYTEFYAPALINNGIFTATDRIVFKFYGNKVSSPDSAYEFQFGGTQPVRASFPVPFNVLPISGGGSTWGNITGALSAQTDLQTALDAKQNNAIVVSTNQVAVNNANYHVIANATFTDPTGVDGKGYRVFVRAGVATINSVAYPAGATILRIFDGGTWVSYVNSGTNTGDETQSSILAKLEITKLKVTGDQSTTSTTAVDITDLVSGILTSGKYSVSGSIGVGSTTTAGLKIGITIPSGATMRIRATDRGSTQNNAVNEILSTPGALSSSNFAQLNGDSVVFFEGTITIGATSGVVQLIFAKTTSGTATIYDEGTQIKLEKW